MPNTPSTPKKSTPRRTIGANPLDAVIPDLRAQASQDAAQPSEPAQPDPAEAAPTREAKERLTIHIPTPLIDRVKNAVFWTPGLTLADLGAQALEEHVARLENENGGPFEPRRHELKGGRPLR